MHPASADIFCRVVDNLGDAGVCWRLARQLADEHGLAVRLYIDRPDAVAVIGATDTQPDTPPRDASLPDAAPWDTPPGGSVTIAAWADPWPPGAPLPADLVIAAFACRLPPPYLDAMAARTPRPAWFNLEYLSAEPWVAGAHGLASPRPDRPLVERFHFPGFEPGTGGLLRERGLLARRDAFRADPARQAALCAALGIAPRRDGETLVSMFCYPDAPLAALLAACRDGARCVRVLLPEGVGREAFGALFGRPPAAGMTARAGRLQVDVVPLVPQPRYDGMLWLADVNFVRGEDSFVRAQWAAAPMVWQPYGQADGAHHDKLDAFLARYLPSSEARSTQAAREMMHAWNGRADGAGPPGGSGPGRDGDRVARAWTAFLAARHDIVALAGRWCDALARQSDLAAGLVEAARKML